MFDKLQKTNAIHRIYGNIFQCNRGESRCSLDGVIRFLAIHLWDLDLVLASEDVDGGGIKIIRLR